ncbi:MAG: amino acid permease [Ruminococcus sp.]|nr:amino acid permease [Ruminococcus sp.]
MKDKNAEQLTPYISPMGAFAMSVGTSLGWGLVVITSTTYLSEAGPMGSILGLLAGLAVMLVISRNYHYMMNCIPDPGGAYSYAKESFGYDHGFLSAWFLALTYVAMFWANVTAIPLFFNYLAKDIFKFGPSYTIFGHEVSLGETLLAIAAILTVTFVCTRARKSLTVTMIVLSLLFILGIAVCAGSSLAGGGSESMRPLFLPDSPAILQVIRIAVISPWAYIGFENISHSSAEFTFPVKKSFRILTVSLVVSAVMYIAVILMSVSCYPPEYGSWLEYVSDLDSLHGVKALPSFYAADHYLGKAGVYIMAGAVGALMMTSLIGNLIPLSRLLYAMAKDEMLPKGFAVLNSRGVPARAMWLVGGVSILIPFLGRSALGWIVDVTTIGATMIYGLISASAWKMARSRGDKKYVATGIVSMVLMIVFALYLLLFNLVSTRSMEAESYFLFTVWTVLGFIFFFRLLKKDDRRIYGRSTIVWVALLLLVLFTSLIWMSRSTMDSTDRALNEVREYYSTGSADAEDEQDFMDMKLDALRKTNVKSMLVVTVLFAVSLGIHLLLQRQHQALERDKMRVEEESRAKSRFMFNMSHDIRTPMNAIIGFTHLARQPGVSPEEKDAYLDKIDTSSQQLLAIINDILDMSRIESGKIELMPEITDLEEVMTTVKDLFVHQMEEKDIDFTVDLSGVSDRYVVCDKNRLDRVLLNLLSNAHKFTENGGRVSLTLTEESCREGLGDYVIRVEDNGIGMSGEFRANMFNAFERERTSTVTKLQGTGLGLSITKGIVDMMNGTIDVQSQPGKGSQFTVSVTFPIADAPAQSSKENEDRSRPDFGSKRLLVVEDNAVNMEIACMILSQQGFMLDKAEDGKAAVEMVMDSLPGYYDAILMDIQMPVMNGYEAARAIRALPDKELAGIPIIAMTANVFQEDVLAAKNAGMDAHIAKPLDIGVMMETLTEVLSKPKDG